MKMLWTGAGIPAMHVGSDKVSSDQAHDVLACRYAGYRPGEDVIEHQGGDAELGQGAPNASLTTLYTPPRTKH